MAARKFPRQSLIFTIVVFSLALGAYLYTQVLPYHFPNQWRPTPDELSAGGYYDRTDEKSYFHGQEALSYEVPLPKKKPPTAVLGEHTGNKRIEVDLSSQRVYAYEGNNRVYAFVVSTGKWGATPTGSFTIQYKTRAQKMSGGSRALNTYYYLPNVPYVQFFGNSQIPWSRGFSFHGTYWHSNFGNPMSHGCINMRTEDAEKLYYWTTPALGDKRTIKATADNSGTPVVIYGKTPGT